MASDPGLRSIVSPKYLTGFIITFLVLSCKSGIEKERYWFNVGFDTTYHILRLRHGSPDERVEKVIKSLKRRARNRKELERYKNALFTGVEAINSAYEAFPYGRVKGEGLDRFEVALDVVVKLYNRVETELGGWEYPSLTTWPEEYTRDYYQKTMPKMYGFPLFSYRYAKAKHERNLAGAKTFLAYLEENSEVIRKEAWKKYLVERKFGTLSSRISYYPFIFSK